MIHTIVDIILLANILLLSALNRQINKRIENIEKWILNSERKKEL